MIPIKGLSLGEQIHVEEWRAALWTQALADQGIADAPGGAALQARFREARLHHFRFEPGAKVQCACCAFLKLPFDALQLTLCLLASELVQIVFAFSLARCACLGSTGVYWPSVLSRAQREPPPPPPLPPPPNPHTHTHT